MHIDPVWLLREAEQRSARNVARSLGCTHKIVVKYIRLANGRVRQASLPMIEHSWAFTSEQHDIIEGLLLSDANLAMPPRCRYPRFSISLSSKNVDLIDLIIQKFPQVSWHRHNVLARTSTPAKGKLAGRIINGGPQTALSTPVSDSWLIYFRRWYPNGRKVVPSDLGITPAMLRWAFYGDGTTSWVGRHRHSVEVALCSEGFTFSDNMVLHHKLAEQGIVLRTKPVDGSVLLRSSRAEVVEAFLSYIGVCEVASMQYKWKWPHLQELTRSRWQLFNALTGEVHITEGLNRWCIEHGLDSRNMRRVAKGNYSQHKGWLCSQL